MMVHTLLVDAINDGFPSMSLPKHQGKLYNDPIRDIHIFLANNTALIDIPRGGVRTATLALA